MAKKKSRSKNRIKAPKRIAGVRLPKPLRRRVDDLLATEFGRDMLAQAIVTAAAGLIGSQAQRGSPTRRFLHHEESDEHDSRPGAGERPNPREALAYAIGEASRSFAEALHRGPPNPDLQPAWQDPEPADEAPDPPKKPHAGRAPSPIP